jgi:hypothetical protein
MITDVTVKYLYAERKVNSNKFVMKFSISPVRSTLTSTSFDSSNFVTNMPIQNTKISYDVSSGIVTLEGEYLEALEGRGFTLNVAYTNDITFYAEPTTTSYTAQGINAQLTLDTSASFNDILPYIVEAEGIIAIVVAIFASIVGLKLAGLELLLPVQLLYFGLATVGAQSSYMSSLSKLKFANGYSAIATYSYIRTFSQNSHLVAIEYESEFILSTNVMLGLFVIILVWLLVHHIRIKMKEDDLEKLLILKSTVSALNEDKKVDSDESERPSDDVDEEEHRLKKGRKEQDEYNLEDEHELREEHHYSLKIFAF